MEAKTLGFSHRFKVLQCVCVFRAQWGAGAALRSLSDSDDQMGKKSNPQKIYRASNKTQELRGPKFNPQKKSRAEP